MGCVLVATTADFRDREVARDARDARCLSRRRGSGIEGRWSRGEWPCETVLLLHEGCRGETTLGFSSQDRVRCQGVPAMMRHPVRRACGRAAVGPVQQQRRTARHNTETHAPTHSIPRTAHLTSPHSCLQHTHAHSPLTATMAGRFVRASKYRECGWRRGEADMATDNGNQATCLAKAPRRCGRCIRCACIDERTC